MWSLSQIKATWIIRIGRQVKVIQKAAMIIRRTPETHVSLWPALVRLLGHYVPETWSSLDL